MIQSLVKQKRALGIYASEYDLPDNLTANQWTLLEKTALVMGPFEELTRKVSSSDAMAADVIPAITVLLRFLSRENEEDHGIKTMKGLQLSRSDLPMWKETLSTTSQLYSIRGRPACVCVRACVYGVSEK